MYIKQSDFYSYSHCSIPSWAPSASKYGRRPTESASIASSCRRVPGACYAGRATHVKHGLYDHTTL